jgi:hypothetical protein
MPNDVANSVSFPGAWWTLNNDRSARVQSSDDLDLFRVCLFGEKNIVITYASRWNLFFCSVCATTRFFGSNTGAEPFLHSPCYLC